jgi:hypothetical protein
MKSMRVGLGLKMPACAKLKRGIVNRIATVRQPFANRWDELVTQGPQELPIPRVRRRQLDLDLAAARTAPANLGRDVPFVNRQNWQWGRQREPSPWQP